MKYFLIFLVLISFKSLAEIIHASSENDQNPSKQTKIILETLFSDIGIEKKMQPLIENQPAPAPAPIPTHSPTPTIVPTETPKPITAGELKIQELLKKNKEALKKQKEDEKDAAFKKKYYKKDDNIYAEIRSENEENLKKLKNENQATLSAWNAEVKKTREQWEKMRKEFLSNVKNYKKNTFNLEEHEEKLQAGAHDFQITPLTKNYVEKLSSSDYRLIKNAMDIPIRNQGKRPTCSAFSGIRAIEILLKSNNIESDLSEQYFYWSSRPGCQQAPCSSKGSWAAQGYDQSMQAKMPDIPLEKFCPYKEVSINNNETQIPLGQTCQEGFVKINHYKRLNSLPETMAALDAGKPVIAGFTLTPNFYLSNGFITYKNSKSKGQMDSHAEGHAILLIGYIPLPAKYHAEEGQVCFITANSWGEGWGRGGYSCLSETWVLKQRVKNAFLSIESVIN